MGTPVDGIKHEDQEEGMGVLWRALLAHCALALTQNSSHRCQAIIEKLFQAAGSVLKSECISEVESYLTQVCIHVCMYVMCMCAVSFCLSMLQMLL